MIPLWKNVSIGHIEISRRNGLCLSINGVKQLNNWLLYIPTDSWARGLDLFMDLLPLSELGFKHAVPEKERRPTYNPSTLLKLYLYGNKLLSGHLGNWRIPVR
jgi:hypothetical protein